jgi:transcriptional regulatory protein RtcR
LDGIMAKKTVALGLFGTTLDRSSGPNRWDMWRPSIDIFRQEDLLIDTFHLIGDPQFRRPIHVLLEDIKEVSPETELEVHWLEWEDPWAFDEVFHKLFSFAESFPFDPDEADYLINITTGTHVAQICMFLLTEAGYLPGKLLQLQPPKKRTGSGTPGQYRIIDLDLSKYDLIADRFRATQEDNRAFLKSGIATRNAAFNKLIDELELVAIHSQAPMLIMGPTGSGKSHLAKRIFELKKLRQKLKGDFVETNCATLRGDTAMSTLFGHVRGAFTGAQQDRDGLLRRANGGVLFLDEIGELGADEQAMLLRALEEKRFMPMGSDRDVESHFQMIAGTNKDLFAEVDAGRFREDLLARLNLWTFEMPALKDRPEDIEPNLHYELAQLSQQTGNKIQFNKESWERYLKFATGREGLWRANFRDLNASVIRMSTLAGGKRIGEDLVNTEMDRLRRQWRINAQSEMGRKEDQDLIALLGEAGYADLDRFDRVQLREVVHVCRECRSLAEAGRELFDVSRQKKKTSNDSDRLRKYLARFGIDAKQIVFAK